MTLTADEAADMPVSERVANGVAWLDENAPAGWRDRIDTDQLDMWSGRKCVLGQVFADCNGDEYFQNGFTHGITLAGNLPAAEWSVPCGFLPYGITHNELGRAWVDYLTRVEAS